MQIKAFTLVELIVVITILAILGTIAFISLQGYSTSARDSTRLSDLGSIETSLELFSLQAGYYPEPDNSYQITYSGAEVWTQGSAGENVISQLQKLSKLPLDPLSSTQYTYSRLNTKGEIEVATILENSDIVHMNQSLAAKKKVNAYISGTYNGMIAKVSTGSYSYILAVPTIINGDLSLLDYNSILLNNKLVISGGDVLPAGYSDSSFDTSGSFDHGLSNIVVWEDSNNQLPSDDSGVIELINNIHDSYSGSNISNGDILALINTTDIGDIKVLGSTLVEDKLGGNVVLSSDNTPTAPDGQYIPGQKITSVGGVRFDGNYPTPTASGWISPEQGPLPEYYEPGYYWTRSIPIAPIRHDPLTSVIDDVEAYWNSAYGATTHSHTLISVSIGGGGGYSQGQAVYEFMTSVTGGQIKTSTVFRVSCSYHPNSICSEVPILQWPSDGLSNLSYSGSTFIAHSYDTDASASEKSPGVSGYDTTDTVSLPNVGIRLEVTANGFAIGNKGNEEQTTMYYIDGSIQRTIDNSLRNSYGLSDISIPY